MRGLLLAGLELRRYHRGHLARAAVVAIVLLPLLYGTVYLAAFWNPYENLSTLPVALVNQDQPAQANGKTIDAGAQLQQTLTSGKDFDWNVASESAAKEGLSDGTYYFELVIPPNFSQTIASLGTTDPRQAQLQLITNDANNYITSLIAKQAATQIQAGVSQNVINQFVSTSLNDIQTIRRGMAKAAAGADELAGGTGELRSKTQPLPSGTARIAAGNAELAKFADIARGYAKDAERTAAQVVRQARDFAKKNPDSPIAQDLLKAALFAQEQVDSTATTVIGATDQIDELAAGSAELARAAKQLVAGIAKLDRGAETLSAGLSNGVKQIPNWTNGEIANISINVASPVDADLVNEHDPGSYGAGFAPYFLSMSLWVGLLVVFMLLQPFPRRVLMAGGISSLTATVIGYLAVVTLSLAQVFVLLAVVRFGLGIQPSNSLGLLGFMALVSLVYAAILQLLNAALGVAGRLVALVLLMLQLTSSGGTYPIEVSPPFFQAISPYLPMTYVVRGVRHLIGGGNADVTIGAAAILACFGIGAFALTVLVATKQRSVRMKELKPELSL